MNVLPIILFLGKTTKITEDVFGMASGFQFQLSRKSFPSFIFHSVIFEKKKQRRQSVNCFLLSLLHTRMKADLKIAIQCNKSSAFTLSPFFFVPTRSDFIAVGGQRAICYVYFLTIRFTRKTHRTIVLFILKENQIFSFHYIFLCGLIWPYVSNLRIVLHALHIRRSR